ncbi:DUF4124 domain-containing protein [Litchfieldella xinjiangensis]|uniref:DUF4124 domain-containing protein n=1 Tax=Litchfieldella xinjiangensis TaxID=1166948 RepID=UPI0005B8FDF0|nr:DUF4124 domain-containing protein [Halomonas xinjiangensis]
MTWRLVLFTLGLCLPLASLAATVYRSTDAQGNVVFTDQPGQGRERIELPAVTVVPAPRATPPSAATQADAGQDNAASPANSGSPFMPYSRFRIVSPQDEATVPTGQAGNVQVQLGVDPPLREDHRVRLLVDGSISQSAMHTAAFMLTNLARGEHVLEAELLDASGEVRHRSAPVTLHVQRASVNLPQNPN